MITSSRLRMWTLFFSARRRWSDLKCWKMRRRERSSLSSDQEILVLQFFFFFNLQDTSPKPTLAKSHHRGVSLTLLTCPIELTEKLCTSNCFGQIIMTFNRGKEKKMCGAFVCWWGPQRAQLSVMNVDCHYLISKLLNSEIIWEQQRVFFFGW